LEQDTSNFEIHTFRKFALDLLLNMVHLSKFKKEISEGVAPSQKSIGGRIMKVTVIERPKFN
jgi:hypothetical protein